MLPVSNTTWCNYFIIYAIYTKCCIDFILKQLTVLNPVLNFTSIDKQACDASASPIMYQWITMQSKRNRIKVMLCDFVEYKIKMAE